MEKSGLIGIPTPSRAPSCRKGVPPSGGRLNLTPPTPSQARLTAAVEADACPKVLPKVEESWSPVSPARPAGFASNAPGPEASARPVPAIPASQASRPSENSSPVPT